MLLMGKLTMPMAIFNSYVKLPEGKVYEGMLGEDLWVFTIGVNKLSRDRQVFARKNMHHSSLMSCFSSKWSSST